MASRGQGGAGRSTSELPLHTQLRAALPHMRAASTLVLGLADEGTSLSTEQLDDLVRLLDEAAGDGASSTAARVLSDPACMAELLQLAAAAVHWSPEACWRAGGEARDGGARVTPLAATRAAAAGVSLLNTLCLTGVRAATPSTIAHVLHLCRALLRMRVLHSAARQLAAAAAAVRPGAPLPASGLGGAVSPWHTCMLLLGALVAPVLAAHGSHPIRASAPALAAECGALCGELAGALRSSRVLEHWAQGLVALAARPECEGPGQAAFKDAMLALLGCLANGIATCEDASRGPPTPAQALAAALRPPGLQHLLVAGGLLAAREVDGGPAYGLDTELYGRLFPPGDAQAVLQGPLTRGMALWWAMELEVAVPGGHRAAGLLGARHWCCVLLRVAGAAVSLWSQNLVAGRVGTHEGAREAGNYANIAYNCLSRLPDQLGRPALQQEEEEEVWALVLRLTDCEVAHDLATGTATISANYLALAQRLRERLQHAARTGRSVEPALSAGLLPHLERLLRGGSRLELAAGARASAAGVLVGLPLLPLLTHGSPREVAALAATLRKVVQRADPAHLATPWTDPVQDVAYKAWKGAYTFLRDALALAMDVSAAAGEAAGGATAVAGPPGGAGLADGDPPAAARPPAHVGPQLTLVVLELLPAVTALLLHADARVAQLLREAVAGGPDRSRIELQVVMGALHYMVLWSSLIIRPLVDTPSGQQGDAAGAAEAAAGGTDGAAGWRDFLLRRVRVVELVGATLHFCSRVASLPGTPLLEEIRLNDFLLLTGIVMQVFPQEAREALGHRAGEAPCLAPGGRAAAGGAPASPRGAHTGEGAGPGAAVAWPFTELLPRIVAHTSEGTAALVQHLLDVATAWARGEEHCKTQWATSPGPLPLAPVAEARSLLRVCSHPACASLEGDSEAELRLQACARCGGAWYCGRACQVAHWHTGHKQECAGRRGMEGVGRGT